MVDQEAKFSQVMIPEESARLLKALAAIKGVYYPDLLAEIIEPYVAPMREFAKEIRSKTGE